LDNPPKNSRSSAAMAAPEPIESDHPSASQMMKLESELSEIKAMLAQ
jgi:hypothetical protein